VQGFGLTIGSDLYLLVDPKARNLYYHINNDEHGNSNSNSNGSVPMTYLHGTFTMLNGTNPLTPIGGVLGIHEVATKGSERVIKGRGIHSIPKRF
jgi:hypothetical protein